MDESSKTKPLTSNRNRIRLPYEPGDFVVPREKLLLTPESEHEEYEAGDLIWVKIHGYPWWPCMVTVDPLTGKYIKRETMSDGEQQVEYHVQYFGPKAYRSYTAGQILDYEGKEKYETHLDNLKNTPVSDRAARQKELKIYSIKPGQKRNWTVAATKADEAMSLTREQRIQQLTFEYELVNRYGAKIKSELRTTSSKKPRSRSLSTASKERPAQTSASNSPIVHSRVNEPQTMPVKRGRGRPRGSVGVKRKSSNFTGDVYDFNEFDDELNESTPTKPLLLFSAKRANRGEFTVFANRHRDQIVQENPKLDEQQVTDLLQNKWDLLADDQRNLYVNRAGASLSATGTASSPKLASALEFSDADESASPETPTIVKRKRGRPRRSDKPVVLSSTKRKLSTESDEIALKKPRTIQAQSPNENGSSVKRPRGRPRKSIVVMPNKSDDSPTENSIVKTPPRQSTRSRRRSAVVLDSSFSENQSNILNKSSKENLDENVTIESDLIDSEMEHDLKEMAQEKTNDLKEDESKEFKTEDSKDAKNEDLDGSDDDESEEIKAEISFDRESNEAPNEIENEDFNDIKDHEPIDTLVREDIKDLEDEPLDHNESSLKEDEDISTKSECDEIVSDPGKQQGFQLEMSDDEDEPEDEEDEKEVEEEDNDAPDEKKDDDDESDGNAGSPANSADPALQPESESTQKPPQEEQTDSSKASEPDPSNEENKVNESVPKLKRSYSRRKLKPSASSTELETNGSTAGNNSDAEAISESELTFGAEKGTNFCSKCFLFNNDKMIRCRGSCKRSFHSKCFGVMVEDSTELTCNECKTGKFKCFVCNEHSADVRNCTAYQCPKYYHLDCVKKNYPIRLVKQQQDFRCPLHFCLTCYGQHQDDNVFRCVKKRMFTCIRCPTAYHRMSSCLAAGSVVISNQHIICPEHVKEAKSRHINVSWCFSCNMGGDLVCCERCPNAFHADCLEYKLPDGNFICSSCTKRKQLLYNDVVWVKLGNFRWWPGLIKHPSTVPLNIQNMKHQNGDFPVFFFGSHDYFWVNRGRVFLYMEGDENRRFSCRRMMDKIFKLAMEEAIAQFKLWKQAKQTDLSRKSIKPPPYHYIKMNKPYGNFRQPLVDDATDKEEFQQCECEENDPCGNDAGCFNRLLMYECDSKICRNSEICKNQRFKRRQYVQATPFKTAAGWGLKVLEDVKKGQFVMEYCGELIDEEECNRRLKDLVERGDSNFYFLTIDRDTIIDAGPKGNLSRFMNHSCSPNCETQKWVVNNQTRVGLFAIDDIATGTELTFNYNLESRGHEKIPCLCGAANCSGFIGLQPKKMVVGPSNQSTKDKAKEEDPKPAKRPTKLGESGRKHRLVKMLAEVHEDECFRCGEPGRLVMCDTKSCPKAYHASCLGLEKTPNGRWICPWHHCDVCGRNALHRCDFCPLSLCKLHQDSEKIEKLSNGYQLCYEHVDRPAVRKYLLSLAEKSVKTETIESVKKSLPTANKSDSTQQKAVSNNVKTPIDNLKRKSLSTAADRAARFLRRSKANEEASPVVERSPRKNNKDRSTNENGSAQSISSSSETVTPDTISVENEFKDESEEDSESKSLDTKLSNADEQLSESSEGHKENNLDGDNLEIEMTATFDLIAPKQRLIEAEDDNLNKIKSNQIHCDSITGDQLIKSSLIEQQMETCS